MATFSPTSTATVYSPILETCTPFKTYSSTANCSHRLEADVRYLEQQQKKAQIEPRQASDVNVAPASNEICWFTLPSFPWSPNWLLSLRGAEYFHLYIWVLKDLSWAQSWFYSGHFFGSLAVFWSMYILSHAVHNHNGNEMFASSGQLLWLMANFIWMSGDLHDNAFPDAPHVYDIRTVQAGYVMIAAVVWLLIFYCIVRPMKLLPLNEETKKLYDGTGLKVPPGSYFHTWREYENCHILFWLAKDFCWNTNRAYMWVLLVLPTWFIAADFVRQTFFRKRMVVDHAHYLAQLMWVVANITWAGGELFFPQYDTAFPLWSSDADATHTLRWYSSWVLVCAYTPLVVLYTLWAYSQMNGYTRDEPPGTGTDTNQHNAPPHHHHHHHSIDNHHQYNRVRTHRGGGGTGTAGNNESRAGNHFVSVNYKYVDIESGKEGVTVSAQGLTIVPAAAAGRFSRNSSRDAAVFNEDDDNDDDDGIFENLRGRLPPRLLRPISPSYSAPDISSDSRTYSMYHHAAATAAATAAAATAAATAAANASVAQADDLPSPTA